MEEQPEIASDQDMLTALEATYHLLRAAQPASRSERARRYAVTITEYEKMLSFFRVMVCEERYR